MEIGWDKDKSIILKYDPHHYDDQSVEQWGGLVLASRNSGCRRITFPLCFRLSRATSAAITFAQRSSYRQRVRS
jgi:hypothetical protein